MNYGFNPDLVEIEPEAYTTLGAKLPFTVYNETGQWETPKYEAQADMYETASCTVWGSQNAIEMYMMHVFGFEPNYDERFTRLHCDISVERGGGNPQDAYQSYRHDGLLEPNEPMPPTLKEFEDKGYLTSERKHKAQQWLNKYTITHEWVDNCNDREVIKQLLRYSPISISVTAWYEKNGLYVDMGQRNNHWCTVYGYIEDERGIILKVFDSYDHSEKLLHPNHHISYAKRIHISKALPKRTLWDILKSYLWDIFK